MTPNATTTYYVRANGGTCGATSCAEILINTYDLNVYHSPIDSTCESSPFGLQGGFPQGGIIQEMELLIVFLIQTLQDLALTLSHIHLLIVITVPILPNFQ